MRTLMWSGLMIVALACGGGSKSDSGTVGDGFDLIAFNAYGGFRSCLKNETVHNDFFFREIRTK